VPVNRPYNPLLPPVITTLLIANGLLYLLEPSFGDSLIARFALWPLSTASSDLFTNLHPPFQPWQLLTYAFLHGGIMHLLLNMYALWLFGVRLENLWGSRAFLFFYLVCVLGAGLVQLAVASLGSGPAYPTIGASGGVFGVLLAFGMLFPNEILILFFPPVALKAKWFVILYGAIELWAGVTGTEAGVAHFAHLGGMAFGLLVLLYWRRHPPRRGRYR